MRRDSLRLFISDRILVAVPAISALGLFAGPAAGFDVESDSHGNVIRLAIDDRIGLSDVSCAVLSAPDWIEIVDVLTTAAPPELVLRFDVAPVSEGAHGLVEIEVQSKSPDGAISFSRERVLAFTAVSDAPPLQESFAVLECCLAPSSADEPLSPPEHPTLLTVAPNPFGALVHFVFGLPARGGAVSLEVFDAGGRVLWQRETPNLTGGFHRITWDGRDARGLELPPGTYFGRISSGSWVETTKVQIVR